MNTRIFNDQTPSVVGQNVTVAGWVQAIRDHAKVMFIDLRDRTGLLQVVLLDQKIINDMKQTGLAREFVVQITGKVAKRPDRLINSDLATGAVELQCQSIGVLSRSKTPPFEIENDIATDEEVRMEYRYLDLRRPTMIDRFRLRHKVLHFIRNWLTDQQFIEVETPMLTKDTPEGAREYIVPSRLHPGHGYALPQSPQQYKQLLMVAGFERYFQIARCMRDEDPRGDRQQEFTQLDLEMSFVAEEDILKLIEDLFTQLITHIATDAHLTFRPFKRLTYDQVMTQHKTDKPDLRQNVKDPKEYAFVFVTEIPLFELTKEGGLTTSHHPFTSWQNTPLNNDIMERVGSGQSVDQHELLSIKANAYDLVLNGYEVAGGSIRIHDPQKQHAMFTALGIPNEQINERFGHIIKAFSYGVPPHGGFASGLDRVVMLLANQPNIREVIAFPKTGDGRDLMMGAPGLLSVEKLADLHLSRSKKLK